MEMSLLSGLDRLELGDGRELRLLSAMEVLQARREAALLSRDGRERALCSNACLLARALERQGEPVFRDGCAVLEGLTVQEIGALAKRWADFAREMDPGVTGDEEEVQALKNAWSTRRRSGCTGACCEPSQPCPRRNVSER